MNIIRSITTNNPCYQTGQTITVKGLMLHSVGTPQPSARYFVEMWDSGKYEIGVHGVIDGNTGDIYQCLPWNHYGWHAGGSANGTHVGVEMCEPACIEYTSGPYFTCSDVPTARTVAQRTYESAVELFAHLCTMYSLNPMSDGVIISHKEGHARGVASNHGDPEHLWQGLGMDYTMDTFRKAVLQRMVQDMPTTGGFIYINNIAFPYPDKDSGLQTISTLVNSARTADGVMRGEKIGRDQAKIELTWNVLTPETWSKMLQQFDNFYFTIRYIDMVTNDWTYRTFYAGNRSARPYLIDPTTNRPKYYVQCKVNVIDTGE